MTRFAAIIPLSPKPIDLSRGVALIQSLLQWEGNALGWCLVVDDAPERRRLSELAAFPKTCQAITLENPRRGGGDNWSGGLTSGTLVAFEWIHANTDADFTLIIDTDALVIAPFADNVSAFLKPIPDAGMIGSLVINRNPHLPYEFQAEPRMVTAYRLLPPATAGSDSEEMTTLDGVGSFSMEQRQLFDSVKPVLEAAMRNGYTSNFYCQGGAQVVTPALIDRMASAGFLQHQDLWMKLPFPAEPILEMYIRAVGLRSYNCTRRGEPFGVWYGGLRYSLDETVARGHALIHSVKNDRRYSEAQIRAFFGARAGTADVASPLLG